MIRCDRVTVVRGGRDIVQQASLLLRSGRVTALLGPNGAGKSTLLSVLAGEITPDLGSVHVANRPLAAWSLEELARCRAVLTQHDRLSFSFDVRTVVEMGRLPHEERRAVTRRHAEAALEALDVASLADRSWLRISGGERQRARLARVSAQVAGVERGVVLLDEPTNHLDLRHRSTVGTWVRGLADRGLAVACVLHDLDLACRWADDVVVMRDGRVLDAGPVADVLTPDLLAEAYGVPFREVTLPGDDGVVWLPAA